MGTQIQANFAELHTAQKTIDTARVSVSDVKLSFEEKASDSQALEEFRTRAKEFKKLVKSYCDLLESDAREFDLLTQNLEEQDRKSAIAFAEGGASIGAAVLGAIERQESR